jgi:mannitol/fructose-specific phosphotransferase system IIA component (Ntr-type)
MPPREALAVGFAMVSVGAMGIIVGIIALEAGIIRERLFVALVIMAIVTSMISGPSMRIVLHTPKKWSLQDILSPEFFLPDLKAASRREVLREMTSVVCTGAGLNAKKVEKAVWDREEALSTGLGNGLALPHARIDGLKEPLAAVGITPTGVDFDSPDGKPANVIFLVLTPTANPDAQLEIFSEIAKLFRDPRMPEQALRAKSFTDFLALIRAGTK